MRPILLLAAVLSLAATPLRQSTLDEATAAFDRAWRSGAVGEIGNMMVPEGIRLQLGNESHSLVAVRQARTALGEFRGSRSEGTLELQAGPSSTDSAKGSATFRWQTVVQGTSEQVQYTVFVEFTRTQSSWRISAVRVF